MPKNTISGFLTSMPNMVTAFKHSLLSFYADLKKTTSLRHYSKKLCGKKPRLSYGAFGREFLFGLIKIAKQNSVFACMVISQLKLSEMQIQWPLLLQEIWVAESWFSIVFCLVVFFPPQGRTSKKKSGSWAESEKMSLMWATFPLSPLDMMKTEHFSAAHHFCTRTC